jgi:hypothetical protein
MHTPTRQLTVPPAGIGQPRPHVPQLAGSSSSTLHPLEHMAVPGAQTFSWLQVPFVQIG